MDWLLLIVEIASIIAVFLLGLFTKNYLPSYMEKNRLCLVNGENSTINDEWASYEKNVRFLGFIDLDFL